MVTRPRTWCVVVLAAILASAAVAAAEDLAGAAHSTCQMFALDRLARPSSAHFPALGEDGTDARIPGRKRPRDYQVESFVDFRSAAGEPVHHRIYCDLRVLGPNHWELERILMGDGDRAELERRQAARRADAEATLRRRLLIEWVAAGFERDESSVRTRSAMSR